MNVDSASYCGVYKDLVEIIGEPATRKIWTHFAGVSVTFPQRLYSIEFTRQFVAEQMGHMKPCEIARATRLSERRIRQIISELKVEKNSNQNGED